MKMMKNCVRLTENLYISNKTKIDITKKLFNIKPKSRFYFNYNQKIIFQKIMGKYVELKNDVNVFRCKE